MEKPMLGNPHDGVYTRLKPSTVHEGGIGVFAIREIPKGTSLFSNDDGEMVWIDKKEVAEESPQVLKLYEDFCVIKNGRYGCPKNFNLLTVGWYLNEAKDGESPNVICNQETYDFVTLRDIWVGEELTVAYSTYSEPGAR